MRRVKTFTNPLEKMQMSFQNKGEVICNAAFMEKRGPVDPRVLAKN